MKFKMADLVYKSQKYRFIIKHFKPVSFKAKFVYRSGLRRQDISLSLESRTIGNSSTALPVPAVDREIKHCTNAYLAEDTDHASGDFRHSVSAHQNRRIQEEIKWSELRERLVNTEIENSFLPNTACVWCHKTAAVARCTYCGPQIYLCLNCSQRLHGSINTYHVLELWKVSSITKFLLAFLYIQCMIVI